MKKEEKKEIKKSNRTLVTILIVLLLVASFVFDITDGNLQLEKINYLEKLS